MMTLYYSGVFLLNFFIIVSGEDSYCYVTSNIGHNSTVGDKNSTVRQKNGTVVIYPPAQLILNCSITPRNSSNLTLTWIKRNDHEVDTVPHPVKKITNFTTSSSYKNWGTHECVIQQNRTIFDKCYFTVIVKTSPIITIKPDFQDRSVQIMECFVYSYFKPSKITWYKDGVQIFPNRTRYSITKKKERDFIFSSTLTIRPYINTKDPGYFTCKGTNNYGTAQNVVFLPFIDEKCPEFVNKETVNRTVSLGSSTSLICKVLYTAHPGHVTLFALQKKMNNSFITLLNGQDAARTLKRWVYLNYTIAHAQINDSGQYECQYEHSLYWKCPKDRLHKTYNVEVISPPLSEYKKLKNLPMVITVSFAGTLCGLGLVLYVCYLRRKSKAQLYDTCPDQLPELRWDVFISYSSHDFAWVNELCQMLERSPFNLNVCIHQRDWELGRTIADNMVESIYCSHKTLVIVSKHYVESEYCSQELQLAMYSEISNEDVQRDRIVLIKIDDVSMHRLPRALRQKSYLDCSDPEHARHFQTNLLRVLPRRENAEDGPMQQEGRCEEGYASGSNREVLLKEVV